MSSAIRRAFHAHGRASSFNTRTNDMPENMGSDGATESTSLLHNQINNIRQRKRLSQHSNPIVSYTGAFLEKTWEVLTSSYANVLLVFVPLGIVSGLAKWDPVTIFVLNFLAIVPLAALLSFATEELSAFMGETLGGLMNATFGNAVELIVSIIALINGEIRIVQSSMLGSILSNILLVLGSCFVAGGIGRKEQKFNKLVAETMASLMAVAAACLIIPATLYAAISNSANGDTEHKGDANTLFLSRGTALIMLILYVMFLYFQLKSHAEYFQPTPPTDEESQNENGQTEEQQQQQQQQDDSSKRKDGDTLKPIPAVIALILVTLLVAVCADYLVDSIDAIVERVHISRTFIGLILLPIVGNAAEHVTAVVVSYKNKMDLAIGVAIGSSLQIALFVTPFLVVLGWIIGQDMTLRFQGFETMVFFLSVLVVNYLIQDGKSNYMEGFMCIGIYIIIALAFALYPDDAGDVGSNGAFKRFFDPAGV